MKLQTCEIDPCTHENESHLLPQAMVQIQNLSVEVFELVPLLDFDENMQEKFLEIFSGAKVTKSQKNIEKYPQRRRFERTHENSCFGSGHGVGNMEFKVTLCFPQVESLNCTGT
jgi:hypothetical protein